MAGDAVRAERGYDVGSLLAEHGRDPVDQLVERHVRQAAVGIAEPLVPVRRPAEDAPGVASSTRRTAPRVSGVAPLPFRDRPALTVGGVHQEEPELGIGQVQRDDRGDPVRVVVRVRHDHAQRPTHGHTLASDVPVRSGIEQVRRQLTEQRSDPFGDRPRSGQLALVPAVHALDVAQGGGEEDLVGRLRLLGRDVPLGDAVHSSSSSRVIPASGPELSGGVTTSSPKTKKMLVPVPSQTWPTVLRKIASPAPQETRVRQAADVLRVRGGLHPGQRAVLVAPPRRGDDRGGRRRRLTGLDGDDQAWAARTRRREPSGPSPPV